MDALYFNLENLINSIDALSEFLWTMRIDLRKTDLSEKNLHISCKDCSQNHAENLNETFNLGIIHESDGLILRFLNNRINFNVLIKQKV